MIDTTAILQNDNKTREELIENALIEKTSKKDYYEIIRIMARTFEFDGIGEIPHQALNLMESELISSKVDLNESVKIVDKRDGKIYGILIFSHFPIQLGSPIMEMDWSRPIGEYLLDFTQINGFGFVLDKRLRGSTIDKQMIRYSEDFLKKYDFVWCATDSDSKTNDYWKYLGGLEILKTKEASFYIKNMGKSNMNDIFILKVLSEKKKKDEEDNNQREE